MFHRTLPLPGFSRWLTGALLGVLAAAAPLAAQAELTTVTGVVRDVSSGVPVPDATVGIPTLRRTAVTDSTGRFVLPDVRLGNHRWVITRLGYVPLDQEMEVVGGDHLAIGILPRPVALEQLTVTVNRAERTLARRRHGSGQSVRYLHGPAVSAAPHGTAEQFVRSQMFVQMCEPEAMEWGVFDCATYRGRTLPISVYIDEEHAYGGLMQLAAYAPSELYAVELWQRGTVVRVYTNHFIEQLARDGKRLIPNPW